tara:strand:+ start:953 stop:1102 length:150 start_codon:yes stop_codon:yes gene_type:complete
LKSLLELSAETGQAEFISSKRTWDIDCAELHAAELGANVEAQTLDTSTV